MPLREIEREEQEEQLRIQVSIFAIFHVEPTKNHLSSYVERLGPNLGPFTAVAEDTARAEDIFRAHSLCYLGVQSCPAFACVCACWAACHAAASHVVHVGLHMLRPAQCRPSVVGWLPMPQSHKSSNIFIWMLTKRAGLYSQQGADCHVVPHRRRPRHSQQSLPPRRPPRRSAKRRRRSTLEPQRPRPRGKRRRWQAQVQHRCPQLPQVPRRMRPF